MNLVKIAMSM